MDGEPNYNSGKEKSDMEMYKNLDKEKDHKDIIFNMEELLESHMQEQGEYVNLNEVRNILKEQKAQLYSKMTDILRCETDVILNLAKDFTFIENKIENLNCPLAQLEEEVKKVCIETKNSKQHLGSLIQNIEDLKHQKKLATCKINALEEIQKAKKIMDDHAKQSPDDVNAIDYMELVERLVDQNAVNLTEIILNLEFELSSQDKEIIVSLNTQLIEVFISGLHLGETNAVIQSLNLFMRWGLVTEAEHIVRNEFVHKPLKDILTEEYLKKCNNNVDVMFEEVMKICNKYFHGVVASIKCDKTLHIYNFGESCIFPEVNDLVKVNLASIAAPGDPNVFHKNFISCSKFLRRMSEFMLNPEEFLNSMLAIDFMKIFNIDVYFQIRSTEINKIVGETFYINTVFESNDFMPTEENMENCSVSMYDGQVVKFELPSIANMARAIITCYDKEIFLQLLTYKFNNYIWNVFMDYEKWLHYVLMEVDDKKNPPELPGYNTNSGNITIQENRIKFEDRVRFLISVLKDEKTLLEQFFPIFLNNPIITESNQDIRVKVTKIQNMLQLREESIGAYLYFVLEKAAYVQILYLNQIPRLFRRTNRAYPTIPSPWVSDLFVPLRHFVGICTADKELESIQDTVVHNFIIATNMSIFNHLLQLLTSLGATEMSLRRLKIRNNLESALTTDEVKIREQLRLDIVAYVEEARTYSCADVELENAFTNLVNLLKINS